MGERDFGFAQDVFGRRPLQVDFDITLFPRLAKVEDAADRLSQKVRFKVADGLWRAAYEFDGLADRCQQLAGRLEQLD